MNSRASISLPFPSRFESDSASTTQTGPTLVTSYIERCRHRESAGLLAGTLLVGDWFFASMAVFAGLALRVIQRGDWYTFWTNFSGAFSPAVLWVFGGGSLFTWLMFLFRSYETKNIFSTHLWTKSLLMSAMIWPVVMLAIIGLTRYSALAPRLGLAYCVGTLITLLVFWRFFALVFLIHPAMQNAARARIIAVGWNELAAKLLRSVRRDPARTEDIIGCVPSPGGHFRAQPPVDVAILGDYSRLSDLVRQCEATSIVLVDATCPLSEIHHLIAFCQREYLDFRLVPEYFPALASSLEVKVAHGVPLLGVRELPLDRSFNRILKRTMDIVGGIIGSLLAAPVILLFGVLVHIESPGPIIYRQVRTTRSGRNFWIYKIRSMKMSAEVSTGAVWARRDDPRRLKVGAFMRRWNIDELPQFINVLKGDMSLVGPRPERPELIEKFKDEIPNYNVRHVVRAGLTGLAQVRGFRGDTDLGKRIEQDIHYLENWSLVLDFYCIVATFFKHENAH